MNIVNGLPEFCFSVNNITNEVILIKRGESGYYPYFDGIYKGEDYAKRRNDEFGITPAQVDAMVIGSMFGWDVPGAKVNT